MIRAKMNTLHIPQLCECDTHQKIFYNLEQDYKFTDKQDLLNNLKRWNNGIFKCWVYQLKESTDY